MKRRRSIAREQTGKKRFVSLTPRPLPLLALPLSVLGSILQGCRCSDMGALNISVFDMGIILTMASLANLISSFFSGRLTQVYACKSPYLGNLNFRIASCNHSIININGLPAVIITLIGITSGFFGQSIAWAAEQIEEKVKRIGKMNYEVALGAYNRMLHAELD